MESTKITNALRICVLLALFGTALISFSACSGKQNLESDEHSSATSNELVEACLSSSNMSQALCECIADKAEEDLSDDGLAFLVASLTEDESESERLRSKMPLQDIMKAGMFMTSAPASCAADGVEP